MEHFAASPIVLEGPEIVLRPLSMADAKPLSVAAAESREHYGLSPVPDGVEGAARYVERALRDRSAGLRIPFTIVWRSRVVGSTSFWDLQSWEWPVDSPFCRVNRPDVVEIGHTWLAASAQRTPCNTEAKLLLLTHAFDVWDVHRVALRTDARNQRSRNAIVRLGATFEGIRRADKPATDGIVRDSAFFSIIRAEWPDVRARLGSLLAR